MKMKLPANKKGICSIGNKNVSLDIFRESGDIYELNSSEIGINLSSGNKLDPYSCINFYLNSGENNRKPMMDRKNLTECGYNIDSIYWCGSLDSIKYTITFQTSPKNSSWFWTIQLENESMDIISTDLTYYMDKGLAPRNNLKTNEYYNSHYLDCAALKDPKSGHVIATRQNLDLISGKTPWLIEGCFSGCSSFATDGEDFFGKSYRSTGLPEALSSKCLPARIRQGQYAISALQTDRIDLSKGEKKEIVFWGLYSNEHSHVSSSDDLLFVQECLKEFSDLPHRDYPYSIKIESQYNSFAETLSGSSLLEESLIPHWDQNPLYPEIGPDGKLWSFFQNDKHIILKEKDSNMDVPHGHILRSGSQLMPDDKILSLSCYMNGCFASQMAIGNSYFNSFLSHPRSLHDLFRANGLRVAVDSGDGFRILSVPSAFVVSQNAAEWIYKLEDNEIYLKSETDRLESDFHFSIRCKENKPLRFKIFFFLKHGEDNIRFVPNIDIYQNRTGIIKPHVDSLFGKRFPGLSINVTANDNLGSRTREISTNSEFVYEEENITSPIILFETELISMYDITVSIDFSDKTPIVSRLGLGGDNIGFLEVPKASGEDPKTSYIMEKLNIVNTWFANNALVHFSVLHGLEQSKGAAWGVRDVLQGPFEALLAQENWQALQELLKLVFAAQYEEDGTWPQWFMLDSYHEIRDMHAHGDIVFWPLKAICEYLEESFDHNFLNCQIPYTRRKDMKISIETESIAQHLCKVIEVIENTYLISDTGLLKYGGGDWNDTLQPLDNNIKERLVSVWTMGIAQQYISRLNLLINADEFVELSYRINNLSEILSGAFSNIISKFNPVPGFLLTGDSIKPFIHPEDGLSNPSYRLLPMIRFINAGLFSETEARTHLQIIEANLWHPDGVRLLDQPVEYNGGKSNCFVRAEQSSFWGREVGLMYVHAHIRFIEALLKLGEAEKAWKAINQIIPVDLKKTVPNAAPRQSNSYFSSSDAAFLNRDEADVEFNSVKEGDILCNGGWRIYSSGPGIFLSLIKRWFFGFRFSSEYAVIDPVIPASLSGCGLTFKVQNQKTLTLRIYSQKGDVCGVKNIQINGKEVTFKTENQPYRDGGAMIERKILESLLDKKENEMQVIL